MTPRIRPSAEANFDAEEVRRFGALAEEWWDANGKFRTLHQIGPARLAFIRKVALGHFRLDERGLKPFTGLTLLDIGCGGGLVSEPMTRLGASVLGIDPAPENVAAARRHAESVGLRVAYEATTVEALAAGGRTFDVVLALEVIEHVPEPGAFLAACARVLAPGGLLIASTINRTIKAYALAIVAAEHVLRWVPAGTHRWERFVTPDEMSRYLEQSGLAAHPPEGIVFEPWSGEWRLSSDVDVNYMIAATRPRRSA